MKGETIGLICISGVRNRNTYFFVLEFKINLHFLSLKMGRENLVLCLYKYADKERNKFHVEIEFSFITCGHNIK
jgi:hypothetical protein